MAKETGPSSTKTIDSYVNAAKVDYSKKELTPYRVLDLDTLDFIPFGSDNLFPQALALFSRLSPNHRGVLTSKNKYMHGSGIIGTDTYSEEFIKAVNYEGESLNQVQKKNWTDHNLLGNTWIEFITDKKGSFLFINHLDTTKVRLEKPEADEPGSQEVIIHPDWSLDSGSNDKRRICRALYPTWAEDEDEPGILRTIYQKKDYEPEFYYYGIPGYISGKDSIQIDFKTNKWNLARLVNSFRLSGMLFVPVKDKVEGDKVLKNIEDNYTGEGNQGKLLVVTKSRAPEGTKAEDPSLVETKAEETGSWQDLHKQSLADIIMAHAWYRSLLSTGDSTGFDTERILNEYSVALQTQILDEQKEFINIYQKLHKEVLNKDLAIEFKNTPPLETDAYYKLWELRKRKGLDYDEKDPSQQIILLPSGYQTNAQPAAKTPQP